tara:strand:- start:597 stop:809 length:213 start_codon:yes stop_codon:yes gene_type:complete
MRFKTREDFIKEIGIRKLGLVEYLFELEKSGKSKNEILAIMISTKVSKTPRSLDMDWKFYENIRPFVGWK